jgi:DSF synthase
MTVLADPLDFPRSSFAQSTRSNHIGPRRRYNAASDLRSARDWHEKRYETIDIVRDTNNEACWCFMQPKGRPSFTPELLRDLENMQDSFRTAFASSADLDTERFKFFVMASHTPGVFNLGGDLALFAQRIRMKDRESLRDYAYATIRALYSNLEAYEAPVVSIALVQGDALGGGFECALSFDVIVAERGARFGFPEILFNLFPGMGAYSLLSRRIGRIEAERMILSGNIYSAEDLHRLGAIDVVAETGSGEAAVRELIAQQRRKHNAHVSFYRARRRVDAVTFGELQDVVDIWVDAALNVTEADLRKMERLAAAQERRSNRQQPATLQAAG